MADSNIAGSGRMTPLTDLELIEIGDALHDDKNLPYLGLHLGFSRAEVDTFLVTNRVDGKISSKGTKNMLFAWRNKTHGADQVRELRNALMASNLGHIYHKHNFWDMADSIAGVGRMTSLTDMKLNEIGNALVNDKNLPDLGLHLGFSRAEVDIFLVTNRVDGTISSKGTKNMLSAWRNNTPGADQVRKLWDALVASNLGHFAEKHLK